MTEQRTNVSVDSISRYASGAIIQPDDVIVQQDDWVPDDALAALVEERTVYPERGNTTVAKAIFDRNSPVAAQAIVHMTMHSKSERIRLDAAKYVLDRALGKIGDEKVTADSDPLAQFFTEVSEYASNNPQV